MSGSGLADGAVYDALTALAALVHAARPLTLDALSTALDWSGDRTAAALDTIRRQPAIADPLTLRDTGSESYTLIARPDRLSPAQRQALDEK